MLRFARNDKVSLGGGRRLLRFARNNQWKLPNQNQNNLPFINWVINIARQGVPKQSPSVTKTPLSLRAQRSNLPGSIPPPQSHFLFLTIIHVPSMSGTRTGVSGIFLPNSSTAFLIPS